MNNGRLGRVWSGWTSPPVFSTWLSSIPGTQIRFGIEAILRLVPGFGDVAASALSCWLLYEAYRLGVPRLLLGHMFFNVAVEGIAGVMPVAGDLFDVGWRANRRNVKLLREHFEKEGAL